MLNLINSDEWKPAVHYFASTMNSYQTAWQQGRETWSHLRVILLKMDEWELKRSVCLTTSRNWKITQHLADEQGKRVRPAIMKPKRSEEWCEKKERRSFISGWRVCQMKKSPKKQRLVVIYRVSSMVTSRKWEM